MKKLVLMFALCPALLTVAQGSFDLVLVADSERKSIRRFDGDSGAYLGEFGRTFLVFQTRLWSNSRLARRM
jgi:hypothetical protein